MATRHWLGVVSRAHVQLGVAGGFAQLCHGRASPLARMGAGDWLIYYSPRTEMRDDAPRLQAFTALGQLADDRVYDFTTRRDEVTRMVARRDVRYEAVQPVPLAELKPRLHLAARPSWAMQLRRGLVELDAHDFTLIAAAMRRR